MVILIVYLLVMIFLYIVPLWLVISKSGQPGVAIIVPIWNIIALCQAAGKPWWWLFLFMIPIANFVFGIMMLHGLSVNFGKTAGFTVGMVLLPFIFIPILGYGGKYVGKKKEDVPAV